MHSYPALFSPLASGHVTEFGPKGCEWINVWYYLDGPTNLPWHSLWDLSSLPCQESVDAENQWRPWAPGDDRDTCRSLTTGAGPLPWPLPHWTVTWTQNKIYFVKPLTLGLASLLHIFRCAQTDQRKERFKKCTTSFIFIRPAKNCKHSGKGWRSACVWWYRNCHVLVVGCRLCSIAGGNLVVLTKIKHVDVLPLSNTTPGNIPVEILIQVYTGWMWIATETLHWRVRGHLGVSLGE